ncbi:hypothetical protein HDV57DRAFT_11703 [Trichoderma longibrachiatum]
MLLICRIDDWWFMGWLVLCFILRSPLSFCFVCLADRMRGIPVSFGDWRGAAALRTSESFLYLAVFSSTKYFQVLCPNLMLLIRSIGFTMCFQSGLQYMRQLSRFAPQVPPLT